ncbi:MAG: cysteine--tRNA ligase, partial [Candidatus Omnitrophica bacterium]|nr:cysteine--tRNA ligase [Candidatus Omnitrophota bacterium]
SFEAGRLTAKDGEKIITFLNRINEVIAVIDTSEEKLPEDIIYLVRKREQARKEKNYQLADSIRKELADRGILLEDTPYGTRWIRK